MKRCYIASFTEFKLFTFYYLIDFTLIIIYYFVNKYSKLRQMYSVVLRNAQF